VTTSIFSRPLASAGPIEQGDHAEFERFWQGEEWFHVHFRCAI
jgi:hypothetical protein